MGAARYKPYPEYKPSGVEWLGDIPKGWETFNGKRLFGNRREIALPTDEQLAASQAFGVVPQSVMMARNNAKVMLATKGTASFRHVEKDDFVISLRSFEGGIEHSAYSGCVSPAYTVLQPLERLDPPYFRYLLKSTPFVSALQATTDSLRDGKSISYEQFGAIALNLPSPPEQTKIAAFLDFETGKIDALIAKQERLIALLEEKRQAVISHAVTKGLDPTAPLRPSGIDWLGDVPEHWVVLKGNYLGNLFGSEVLSESSIKSAGGVPYIKVSSLSANGFDLGDLEFFVSKNREGSVTPQSDFIVFPKRGAAIFTNKVNIVRNPSLLDPNLMGWKCNERMEIEFLAHVLKMKNLEEIADVSTVPQINNKHIHSIWFPVPPVDEQRKIVTALESRNKSFDNLDRKAQSAIALLKERRTALISAAVTGKIDVRDWQPPLPLSDTDLSTETLQEAAV